MGRGEGALLKKASPLKPAGAARVPLSPAVFHIREQQMLVGRRPGGSTVGWGWGKVRQIFYGERSCSIKAVNRQTGLRALRAESTRRLWGRWRHS